MFYDEIKIITVTVLVIPVHLHPELCPSFPISPLSCGMPPPYPLRSDGSTLFQSATTSVEDVAPDEQSTHFPTVSPSTSNQLEVLSSAKLLNHSLDVLLSLLKTTAGCYMIEDILSILIRPQFDPGLSAKQIWLLKKCGNMAKPTANKKLNII